MQEALDFLERIDEKRMEKKKRGIDKDRSSSRIGRYVLGSSHGPVVPAIIPRLKSLLLLFSINLESADFTRE